MLLCAQFICWCIHSVRMSMKDKALGYINAVLRLRYSFVFVLPQHCRGGFPDKTQVIITNLWLEPFNFNKKIISHYILFFAIIIFTLKKLEDFLYKHGNRTSFLYSI